MKRMKPQQVKEAMIEIIHGKRPSSLKIDFPEHYRRIRKEIVEIHSIGGMVKIPVSH